MARSSSKRHLQLLQKIDPSTVDVTACASYAVIYTLINNKWQKQEIEGVLFLTKRKVHPARRIIVVNRIGLNNLIEDIDSTFVFELNEDYIFFKNKSGVRGIWFGKQEDKIAIYESLSRTYTTPQEKEQMPSSHKVQLSREHFKQLLLEMLDDDEIIETMHKKYLDRIKS